jgi:hypothetical protein
MEQIDGILFRSAQTEGVSCVIFCDDSGCADPGGETDESYLRFKPDSVRTVKVVAKPVEL